jgi:hypothetical protein
MRLGGNIMLRFLWRVLEMVVEVFIHAAILAFAILAFLLLMLVIIF